MTSDGNEEHRKTRLVHLWLAAGHAVAIVWAHAHQPGAAFIGGVLATILLIALSIHRRNH